MIRFLKQMALSALILFPIAVFKALAEKHFGWDLDFAYGWAGATTWFLIYFWDDIRT
jgi:hypothetical protein